MPFLQGLPRLTQQMKHALISPELSKTQSLLPWMAYLPDPEAELTWQTALASDRWMAVSQARLGYGAFPVWTPTAGGEHVFHEAFSKKPATATCCKCER